jgi:hypothetical protein
LLLQHQTNRKQQKASWWRRLGKKLLAFIYRGSKTNYNGYGMMYLVKHYILLFSCAALLLHYAVSGCYAFIAPTGNNQLRVTFTDDWMITLQRINTKMIIALIILNCVYSCLLYMFHEWQELDEQKALLDKIYLLKSVHFIHPFIDSCHRVVKENYKIRTKHSFRELLPAFIRRNRWFSYLVLRETHLPRSSAVSMASMSNNSVISEPEISTSIYDTFSSEQKFIIFSDV